MFCMAVSMSVMHMLIHILTKLFCHVHVPPVLVFSKQYFGMLILYCHIHALLFRQLSLCLGTCEVGICSSSALILVASLVFSAASV